MALTYAEPKLKISIGARWLTVTKITFDTKYPTGGYTIALSTCGLPDEAVDFGEMDLVFPTAATTGLKASFNETSGKLQLFWPGAEHAAMSEVSSETDVHTYSGYLMLIGR